LNLCNSLRRFHHLLQVHGRSLGGHGDPVFQHENGPAYLRIAKKMMENECLNRIGGVDLHFFSGEAHFGVDATSWHELCLNSFKELILSLSFNGHLQESLSVARPFGLLPTDSLLSAMAGPPMLSRRCHFQGPDGEKIGINILRNIQIYIYINTIIVIALLVTVK
jgi:hypothetical protein